MIMLDFNSVQYRKEVCRFLASDHFLFLYNSVNPTFFNALFVCFLYLQYLVVANSHMISFSKNQHVFL